jgi:hypothetical protein
MLRPQTYNEVKSGKVLECESCQRILFFDPSKEVAAAPSTAPHHRRRVRPKSDSPQAWFYRPAFADHGEVILAYTNSAGSSARRIYDFNTGREIGDVIIREGKYMLAFPEDFPEDCIRLNGNWDEEELESWGTEMPMTVLDLLHVDLQAARSDARQRKTNPEDAITAEHPAAS